MQSALNLVQYQPLKIITFMDKVIIQQKVKLFNPYFIHDAQIFLAKKWIMIWEYIKPHLSGRDE